MSLKADSCKPIYSDSANFAFYRAIQQLAILRSEHRVLVGQVADLLLQVLERALRLLGRRRGAQVAVRLALDIWNDSGSIVAVTRTGRGATVGNSEMSTACGTR